MRLGVWGLTLISGDGGDEAGGVVDSERRDEVVGLTDSILRLREQWIARVNCVILIRRRQLPLSRVKTMISQILAHIWGVYDLRNAKFSECACWSNTGEHGQLWCAV